MKHLLILLVCMYSSLSQAEGCTTRELVKLEDIARCAKNGDTTAQFLLGQLYFQGKEVPRSYNTAFRWMSKAANQGNKSAQNSLGFDYYNGWGTKKDHVRAYMWWSLSIVNNEEPVTRRNLDSLEEKLSSADLERAQRMASAWLANRQPPSQTEVRSPPR